MNHTLKIIDICKSNMKANRSSCIEQLRTHNRKEVATGIIDLFSGTNLRTHQTSNEVTRDEEDEDDATRYLENEDYEFILNQVMAELSDPSYEDAEDMEYYQHQQSEDAVVCPVCRLNLAEYYSDSDVLVCICGLNLSLLHTPIGAFKCLLSAVFDAHHASVALPCSAEAFPLKFVQTGFDTLNAACSHCGFSRSVCLSG